MVAFSKCGQCGAATTIDSAACSQCGYVFGGGAPITRSVSPDFSEPFAVPANFGRALRWFPCVLGLVLYGFLLSDNKGSLVLIPLFFLAIPICIGVCYAFIYLVCGSVLAYLSEHGTLTFGRYFAGTSAISICVASLVFAFRSYALPEDSVAGIQLLLGIVTLYFLSQVCAILLWFMASFMSPTAP